MSDGLGTLSLTACLGPPISGLQASQRHPGPEIRALIQAHGGDGGKSHGWHVAEVLDYGAPGQSNVVVVAGTLGHKG